MQYCPGAGEPCHWGDALPTAVCSAEGVGILRRLHVANRLAWLLLGGPTDASSPPRERRRAVLPRLSGCGGAIPAAVDEATSGLSVCAKGPVVKGVDVSHYDGTIDGPPRTAPAWPTRS